MRVNPPSTASPSAKELTEDEIRHIVAKRLGAGSPGFTFNDMNASTQKFQGVIDAVTTHLGDTHFASTSNPFVKTVASQDGKHIVLYRSDNNKKPVEAVHVHSQGMDFEENAAHDKNSIAHAMSLIPPDITSITLKGNDQVFNQHVIDIARHMGITVIDPVANKTYAPETKGRTAANPQQDQDSQNAKPQEDPIAAKAADSDAKNDPANGRKVLPPEMLKELPAGAPSVEANPERLLSSGDPAEAHVKNLTAGLTPAEVQKLLAKQREEHTESMKTLIAGVNAAKGVDPRVLAAMHGEISHLRNIIEAMQRQLKESQPGQQFAYKDGVVSVEIKETPQLTAGEQKKLGGRTTRGNHKEIKSNGILIAGADGIYRVEDGGDKPKIATAPTTPPARLLTDGASGNAPGPSPKG